MAGGCADALVVPLGLQVNPDGGADIQFAHTAVSVYGRGGGERPGVPQTLLVLIDCRIRDIGRPELHVRFAVR